MKRIQRKRKKGYRQPEGTRYVGRRTKYGNPFRLSKDGHIEFFNIKDNEWQNWSVSSGFKIYDIIDMYKMWVNKELLFGKSVLPEPPTIDDLKELKKYKYLSCYCSLSELCHVDILIKLINNL